MDSILRPPQQRSKVPVYPRPVPELDFDDIPVCEDTEIYHSPSEGPEWNAEERAGKRLKTRQEWAETYLRGGEVRILTAGLKGPFEGWGNPWKKSKKASGARDSGAILLEVPENTMRPGMLGVVDKLCGSDNMGDSTTRLPGGEQMLLNPFEVRPTATKIALAGQEPSSTKRVEEWLKTSDLYSSRPRVHTGSSPTPTPMPRPLGRGRSPLQQTRSSPQRRSQRTNEAQETSFADAIDPLLSRSGTGLSAQALESPRRAEAAILDDKRKSLYKLPPSTNLPAFEYRRGGRTGKQQAEQAKKAVHTQVPVSTARDGPPTRTTASDLAQSKANNASISRPALSAETSKASTVQNLPSAQPAPAPQYQAEVSNAHSTDELLQELPTASRSGVQHGVVNDVEKMQESPVGDDVKFKSQAAGPAKHSKPPGHDPVQFPMETPAREHETQEMIAALKPFDFSTTKRPMEAPPSTIRKAMTGKGKKKRSLAADHPLSDESQTSIKAGFKIQKAILSNPNDKISPKVVLFGEAAANENQDRDLDKTGDILFDDSLVSFSSMFSAKKPSPPKSILKSSNAQSSAPAPSGDTTSTSVKQDAQPGQNAVVTYGLLDDDPDFDLDAAMSDIGSYLGTWDPEEAASKVAGGA